MAAKMFALAALVAVCLASDKVEGEHPPPGVYYFNTVTSKSMWEYPPEMGYTSKEPSHEGATYWVVNGEATWETPEEWDWREGHDEHEDKPFYYNPRKEKFTWVKPECLGWVEIDTATNSEL